MAEEHDTIVVEAGVCRNCGSVHTTRVHHRDYPELWAEGDSASAAASRLVNRLTRALETLPDRWRSEPVLGAIADAESFIARGDGPARTPRRS